MTLRLWSALKSRANGAGTALPNGYLMLLPQRCIGMMCTRLSCHLLRVCFATSHGSASRLGFNKKCSLKNLAIQVTLCSLAPLPGCMLQLPLECANPPRLAHSMMSSFC
eukprot:197809-Amphidinium_carterae.3